MAVTASALALPAESDSPDDPADLRRAPVPLCDPPFDDETANTDVAAGGGHRDAQGMLALGFTLPGGVPASPEVPTELTPGSHRRLQLVPSVGPKAARTAGHSARRKGRTPDDDFGPRHTPRAQLPEPKPWAGRLVQAIVEVMSGVRPVAQLVRWTTTDVYATMQRRIAHTELANHGARGGRRLGAIVRSIHVDEPADGVAEVCAVVQQGARCRAVALRLEGFDGRWQCTVLQVG
ncbi:MAG TPA: Rv3235 family protein [Acidothermaceae bacterium]|jgi:hypothetical protein